MTFTTGAAILENEEISLSVVSAASSGTLLDGAVDAETKTLLSSNAPFCTLVLTFQVATTTAAAGANILVYRRDMNKGGSLDTEIPTLNNRQHLVGVFEVPIAMVINTDHVLSLPGVPLDGDCEFYLANETGVTINTGWLLQAQAKSFNGAA